MKNRLLYVILPIITLILEVLPYGAVCNFANPEGEPLRKTFSYFDLVPFGYANFAPLLTAIITCIILIMLFIYVFTNVNRIITFTKTLLCVGIIVSFCPLIFGINYYSVVGGLITVSLIAEYVLLSIFVKE